MPDRPHLVCIPSANRTFSRHAWSVFDGLPRDLPLDDARTELERRLRERYPHAAVRPQDPLAALSTGPIWYVTDRSFRSRFAGHIEVGIPPECAFHLYVHRVEAWQTAFTVRPLDLRDELVGSQYEMTYLLLGRALRGRLRLVEADPPRAVRFEADGGGIRVWYLTMFRPTERGTAIDVTGDYDLPDRLLERVADRLGVQRVIQHQIDGAHEALRKLCEDEAPNCPSGGADPGRGSTLRLSSVESPL
jgi:hypothetical protein